MASRQTNDQLAMRVGGRVRHYYQAATRLVRERCYRAFDFGGVVNGGGDRLHRERRSSGHGRTYEIRPFLRRNIGVKNKCDPRDTRRDTLEELQPLGSYG